MRHLARHQAPRLVALADHEAVAITAQVGAHVVERSHERFEFVHALEFERQVPFAARQPVGVRHEALHRLGDLRGPHHAEQHRQQETEQTQQQRGPAQRRDRGVGSRGGDETADARARFGADIEREVAGEVGLARVHDALHSSERRRRHGQRVPERRRHFATQRVSQHEIDAGRLLEPRQERRIERASPAQQSHGQVLVENRGARIEHQPGGAAQRVDGAAGRIEHAALRGASAEGRRAPRVIVATRGRHAGIGDQRARRVEHREEVESEQEALLRQVLGQVAVARGPQQRVALEHRVAAQNLELPRHALAIARQLVA